MRLAADHIQRTEGSNPSNNLPVPKGHNKWFHIQWSRDIMGFLSIWKRHGPNNLHLRCQRKAVVREGAKALFPPPPHIAPDISTLMVITMLSC